MEEILVLSRDRAIAHKQHGRFTLNNRRCFSDFPRKQCLQVILIKQRNGGGTIIRRRRFEHGKASPIITVGIINAKGGCSKNRSQYTPFLQSSYREIKRLRLMVIHERVKAEIKS